MLKQQRKLSFTKFGMLKFNPSRPVHFRKLFFMKAFKAYINPFETPQRSVKIKI